MAKITIESNCPHCDADLLIEVNFWDGWFDCPACGKTSAVEYGEDGCSPCWSVGLGPDKADAYKSLLPANKVNARLMPKTM